MPIEEISADSYSDVLRSVFVSHTSADKGFVRQLAKSLEKEGFSVWVDENELRVGEKFWPKIQHAIAEHDHLILVLSKSMLKSSWVKKEIALADEEEKETNRTVLVPVLIEDVRVPKNLSQRLYADFRTSFKIGMNQLLNSLGEVNVHSYEFPSGIVRANARRGNIGGVQRIINLSAGGDKPFFLNFLVEGMGPVKAVYESTYVVYDSLQTIIHKAVENEWNLDDDLMRLFFVAANTSVVLLHEEKNDSDFAVTGVKMCAAMVVGENVYTAQVGSTGILIGYKEEEQKTYTVVYSKNEYQLLAPSEHAPLGFIFSDLENLRIDIQRFPFRADGDFVALTSFFIPRSDKIVRDIVKLIHASKVPDGTAYELCRLKTPKAVDCLVSVITP